MAKGLPKALMSRVGKGQISMKRAWAIHKGGKSTPTKKRSSKRTRITKTIKRSYGPIKRMARRSYKKKRSKGKPTIPIAPILGLLAPLGGLLGQEIMSGNVNGAFKEASRIYTGYDPTDGSFELGRLAYGLGPAVAGFGAHKVAGLVGINRALGRAKVPYIRI